MLLYGKEAEHNDSIYDSTHYSNPTRDICRSGRKYRRIGGYRAVWRCYCMCSDHLLDY